MGHHVSVKLPGGRVVQADYRQPIVHVMRKILVALVERREPDPELYDLVTEWATECPGQVCAPDRCALHGPALALPFTPPRYVRPNQGGLW